MDDESIFLQMERESASQTERVKAILLEGGRPDLVTELEANLRDVRTGLTGARSAWHSISPAQRKVVAAMAEGRTLVRHPTTPTMYDAHGKPDAISRLCGIKTARALCSRDLLACDGTPFDPEARFVLTEHGRFVADRGPLTPHSSESRND